MRRPLPPPPLLCPHCQAAAGAPGLQPLPLHGARRSRSPRAPPRWGLRWPRVPRTPPCHRAHDGGGGCSGGSAAMGARGGSRGGGRRVGEVISPPGGALSLWGRIPWLFVCTAGWSPRCHGGVTTPSRCAAISGKAPFAPRSQAERDSAWQCQQGTTGGGGQTARLPPAPFLFLTAHPEPHAPFWGGLAESKASHGPPRWRPARRRGDAHSHPVAPRPHCALEGAGAPRCC